MPSIDFRFFTFLTLKRNIEIYAKSPRLDKPSYMIRPRRKKTSSTLRVFGRTLFAFGFWVEW